MYARSSFGVDGQSDAGTPAAGGVAGAGDRLDDDLAVDSGESA
ncbi:hypothetical protein [Nocardia sp. NPDC050175]